MNCTESWWSTYEGWQKWAARQWALCRSTMPEGMHTHLRLPAIAPCGFQLWSCGRLIKKEIPVSPCVFNTQMVIHDSGNLGGTPMTWETSRLQSSNPLSLRFCKYQQSYLQFTNFWNHTRVFRWTHMTCCSRSLLGGHAGHRSGREQQSLSIQVQSSR